MVQVLKWANQMNLAGGQSLCRAVGWNMKNHRHLMFARSLRVETHPRLLIATIRDGEEQDICSATLEGLLRVVEDQIEEESVVVFLLSKESTMRREESTKTRLNNAQLKYVDVGKTRVVTNSRCIAEHVKNDRVEDDVMDGQKLKDMEKL